MSSNDPNEITPERMKLKQQARLELEITELICQVMLDQGISRAELARRLGKSRAYVTQLLGDGSNMTVDTIADIFTALGRSIRVVDRPLSLDTPPLLVMEAPMQPSSPISSLSANYETQRGNARKSL